VSETINQRLRRARFAVSSYFLVMGLTGGIWMARIPAIKDQAHLSDVTLGAALFSVPIGLMIGSFAAERMIDRAGSARLARITGLTYCALSATPGLAHSLAELMPALFTVGLVGGMQDVAQNAQGVRVEAAYGRPVITSMHAAYSFGVIIGSLSGGAFAWAGVAPFPSLAVMSVIGILVNVYVGRWLLPGTYALPVPAATLAAPATDPVPDQSSALPHRTDPGPDPSSAVFHSADPVPDPSTAAPHRAEPIGAVGQSTNPDQAQGDAAPTRPPKRSRAEAWRINRLILAIAIVGICGIVGEGAAGDWTAVYLKDNLGTSAGFAALGFASFSVTMTAGRAFGDRFIHRFGVVLVARVGGLLAAVGLALALAIASPVAAIIGFTIQGAGLCAIVPQAFAAGGRADPERPGSGIAKVVGLCYAGLSAGPAIIGVVAGAVGLRLALAIPVLLALWIAIGASALGINASQHQDFDEERVQLTPNAPTTPAQS
jgi:MFS family permease